MTPGGGSVKPHRLFACAVGVFQYAFTPGITGYSRQVVQVCAVCLVMQCTAMPLGDLIVGPALNNVFFTHALSNLW